MFIKLDLVFHQIHLTFANSLALIVTILLDLGSCDRLLCQLASPPFPSSKYLLAPSIKWCYGSLNDFSSCRPLWSLSGNHVQNCYKLVHSSIIGQSPKKKLFITFIVLTSWILTKLKILILIVINFVDNSIFY